MLLVIDKGGKKGIVQSDNSIVYYDDVQDDNFLPKVKKDGLWGYYQLTSEIKYKELDNFHYTLAAFELPNGKKGYIDVQGNEYFAR